MNEKVVYNFDMCKYAHIKDLDCENVECNFKYKTDNHEIFKIK